MSVRHGWEDGFYFISKETMGERSGLRVQVDGTRRGVRLSSVQIGKNEINRRFRSESRSFFPVPWPSFKQISFAAFFFFPGNDKAMNFVGASSQKGTNGTRFVLLGRSFIRAPSLVLPPTLS